MSQQVLWISYGSKAAIALPLQAVLVPGLDPPPTVEELGSVLEAARTAWVDVAAERTLVAPRGRLAIIGPGSVADEVGVEEVRSD